MPPPLTYEDDGSEEGLSVLVDPPLAVQGQGQDGQDHHLHADEGGEGRKVKKKKEDEGKEREEEVGEKERDYDGHLSAIQHSPTTTLRTI